MSIQCSLQYFSFLSATENITMNSAAKANQMTPRLTCRRELQPAVREHLVPHAEFNQQHGQNGQRDEDHRHAEQPFQPACAGRHWPSARQSRQPDPAVHVRVCAHRRRGGQRQTNRRP